MSSKKKLQNESNTKFEIEANSLDEFKSKLRKLENEVVVQELDEIAGGKVPYSKFFVSGGFTKGQ